MKTPAPILLALAALLAGRLASSHLHAQEPAASQLLMSLAQARAFLTDAGDLDYVPGQTLVKFRAGMTPSDQTRAIGALRRGTTTNASAKWIGDALLLNTPNDPESDAVAATLARQPEVEWAQPNYLRRLKARPNDPAYARQWNMDLIGMPAAWDINPGGRDITVAVVDYGVTTTNTTRTFRLWTGQRFESVPMPFAISPDLAGSRIKPGRDFVFLGPGQPVLDLDGHGTFVASVALQETNNNLGAAGIAYGASLLPLKACFGYWEIQIVLAAFNEPGFVDTDAGGCPDDAIAEAIRFAADSGAQVINLSLGGGAQAPIVRDALAYAVSRGSFVALAGGNEFDEGNPVGYPAAYAEQLDGVMAVGAVTMSSRRASYSSTGSFIEIVAPGGDVADGGTSGMVTQVTLNILDLLPRVIRPRFDTYTLVPFQGTSVSAPHVAGVAALLYSQGVTSPAAIESAIRRSATDLGPSGRDNEFGFGLLNGRAALRGMGLVR